MSAHKPFGRVLWSISAVEAPESVPASAHGLPAESRTVKSLYDSPAFPSTWYAPQGDGNSEYRVFRIAKTGSTGYCAPMLPDYHIHTPLCRHAVGDPADYVAQARRLGVPEMCFTDHNPTPDGVGSDVRMTELEHPEYVEIVRSLRERHGSPEILMGIEADFYPGCEKYLPQWLDQEQFDLVLGSVHYMHGWGFDDEKEMDVWRAVDVPGAWQEYFGLIARMAETGFYDVASHLDVAKKFGYQPPEETIPGIVKTALDSIARAGMAIEINTAGLRKPVGEMYPSPAILRMARERNIPICFGSDAHAPEHVGSNFDKALALAKSIGYTEYVRFRKRKQIPTPLP